MFLEKNLKVVMLIDENILQYKIQSSMNIDKFEWSLPLPTKKAISALVQYQ